MAAREVAVITRGEPLVIPFRRFHSGFKELVERLQAEVVLRYMERLSGPEDVGNRILADIFEKANQQVEWERNLLDRQIAPVAASPPAPNLAPWPDSRLDLTEATAQHNPATLLPGTRASGLKKLVLRVLNLYTYRQIQFNAALVRVLTRWDDRLRSLPGDLSDSSLRLGQWVGRRIALIEERRSLWEARLSGQLTALNDRTGAAESDLAELEARMRQDRARMDALEDSVRKLEALLAGDRKSASVETAL